MATTGELRAIIEELKLVDIGDAADYLGEGTSVEDAYTGNMSLSSSLEDTIEPLATACCIAGRA